MSLKPNAEINTQNRLHKMLVEADKIMDDECFASFLERRLLNCSVER